MGKRFRKITFTINMFALLSFCSLSGCATLGGAGAGFGSMLTALVTIPFTILSKALDIANKLPMPPPGVF